MKPVYEAAHGVEAHMIADLLRQEGISGMVQGEYLQGAVGGLPAAGLVRVVVDEADYDLAKKVIDRWSAAQVHEEPATSAREGALRWPHFFAGLLLGAFAAYVTGLVQAPATAPQVELCRP
ncbi:DUF2007 domain-containing protein [Ramlibacter albus]|uniref:DUF2007 domain-containing protein n=1 Tax=Ramlibacter albus TaxID=2079448 RepID=A0A923M579_9BURK|nr:DUF2007 domain-containing protein [Ramlibacter albus]MBC5764175.1 DUF2007 domain-containing protein [Ramlibacter albus]